MEAMEYKWIGELDGVDYQTTVKINNEELSVITESPHGIAYNHTEQIKLRLKVIPESEFYFIEGPSPVLCNSRFMEVAETLEVLVSSADASAVLDAWSDYHNLRLEGHSGVEKILALAVAFGYRQFGTDNLRDFIADNPGIQEAMFEWIEANMTEKWEQGLLDSLPSN